MNQAHVRRIGILASIAALVLLPMAWGGLYVWRQHQWVAENLARVEPRHARMLGLQAQQAELAQSLQNATALRQQYVYPVSQDEAQTGNLAQQKVRGILSAAGLQIISSQVLPPQEGDRFDSIPLSVRAEGDMLALQSALAVLSSQQPAIFLDELGIQLIGSLTQANHKFAPKLGIQLSLNVLRERP